MTQPQDRYLVPDRPPDDPALPTRERISHLLSALHSAAGGRSFPGRTHFLVTGIRDLATLWAAYQKEMPS